ncbi:MAG: ABC transporter permease subunit [Candidatus Aminicenantes bacterium]|nr:ABC transporter permease subunit [Candidatus Aminicenantes bacterium]
MKIRAIAFNTFKEAIKDRILYLLFFFAAVCFVFSRLLALLTVGDRVKIVTDVGLAALSIIGALMAILVGTGLVYKEIDKKTIFTLLAKPIHRYQFILGKFFGMIVTLGVMLFVMTLIFLAVLFLHTFQIDWRVFLIVFLIFIELSLITAVAILFSSFSTPILSSIFTLAFYLIGHFSWGFETLISKIQSGFLKSAVRGLYTLLPDLENFNYKTEIVHHLPLPSSALLLSILYGIAYTAFILALAMVIFRKRDFL